MADLPTTANEPHRSERFNRIGFWVSGAINFVLLFVVVWLMWGIAALTQGNDMASRSLTDGVTLQAEDDVAIRSVLSDQVAAWNKGDLDGFMAGYWHDEKLTFMSGDRITQGWEATRARYQKKYFTPDKDGKLAERGDLSFAELQIDGFTPKAAVVRGRYILKLANETATGRFTLVFRKLPDGWRIMSDHTSAADRPPEKKQE